MISQITKLSISKTPVAQLLIGAEIINYYSKIVLTIDS